ncbi:hypothetical protein AGOR_G00251300 [Albula goreensis]|uniref:ZP domain-containing protein n=1 Tax=Albula goreensis TaxID=1534307 RepID=A0A8T3CF42_9TELE|nr:hypothetical protein AGOR_G00251300 [Albula goreensis]
MAPSALLLLLASASGAWASHYYGGSMTFTPKGMNPDGSFRVDFRYKEAYHTCYQWNSWYCSSGNCGTQNRFEIGAVDRSATGSSWCQSEGFITRNISIDRPFQMRKTGCCWIYNSISNSGSWRLLTHVDLGIRSDTQEPNRSPVTTIPPFIRVPQNCRRTYNLVAHDPDGDQVRCRYGAAYGTECNFCNQHSGFQLDKNSCTLTYVSSSSLNAHAFEIVLEDYPRQHITLTYTDGTTSVKSPLLARRNKQATTTTPSTIPWWPSTETTPIPTTPSHGLQTGPLSKIPLQFSIRIDPAVSSCAEGLILPQFLSPTPTNGDLLTSFVNEELEIRLKATATQSSVNNFIISGPLNITKYITDNGTFADAVIWWTPTENDFGERIPICFIAESVSGSRVYHSEMRCVIVTVGHSFGEANVICTENTMTVEVEKSSIIGLHEDHLRLNDASCTLTSNSTHVIATMSLNSCGTQLEESAENLIFKNEITSYDKATDIITRKHHVEIGFSCVYPKKGKASLEFRTHKIPYVFTEKGFGKFTYEFEFFHSPLFHTMMDPRAYPIEVALNEMIYMEIKATSSLSNTVIFVESCRATPIDDPNYHTFYDIIDNGCVVDDTVVVYSSGQSTYHFGMEAFKFIGQHEEVYISCSVVLCMAENPDTRCSQGCRNATASPAVHHHHRRAASAETSTHYISQGPLRLKMAANQPVSTMGLNMNLVFIAGTILLAVAMVCAVVIYRAKGSKIKYQPLPSSDF